MTIARRPNAMPRPLSPARRAEVSTRQLRVERRITQLENREFQIAAQLKDLRREWNALNRKLYPQDAVILRRSPARPTFFD